jgi:hypothetical protein
MLREIVKTGSLSVTFSGDGLKPDLVLAGMGDSFRGCQGKRA